MNELANRLKQARVDAGLTQRALALAAGVPETAVSNYERGKHQPSITRLVGLSRALGVSADWLLKGRNNAQ